MPLAATLSCSFQRDALDIRDATTLHLPASPTTQFKPFQLRLSLPKIHQNPMMYIFSLYSVPLEFTRSKGHGGTKNSRGESVHGETWMTRMSHGAGAGSCTAAASRTQPTGTAYGRSGAQRRLASVVGISIQRPPLRNPTDRRARVSTRKQGYAARVRGSRSGRQPNHATLDHINTRVVQPMVARANHLQQPIPPPRHGTHRAPSETRAGSDGRWWPGQGLPQHKLPGNQFRHVCRSTCAGTRGFTLELYRISTR